MELDIDKQIIECIIQKRVYKKYFSDLIMEFESKFTVFNPIKTSFEISSYFMKGKGDTKKKLIADGVLNKEWLRDYETKNGKVKNDFQGLYVFLMAILLAMLVYPKVS